MKHSLTMNKKMPRLKLSPANAQRGMALIFTLIVLVALMIASVAMVKVVNSSSQIAGNLAFRQDALLTSERASQFAIKSMTDLLIDNPNSLNENLTDIGYFASQPINLDPTGNALEDNNARILIKWDEAYCDSFTDGSYSECTLVPRAKVVDTNGNNSSYIIFRLCSKPGLYTDTSVNCAKGAPSTGAGGALQIGDECQGALSYENPNFCLQSGAESAVLYRILVRTVGPRNTVSYTETLAYF